MQQTDDSALLRQYSENHSDEVFSTLVARHINLVYSVALRHVGNSHHAEEITQSVFILLAKKAAHLRHDKALSSWLFQTTHLTANNFVRSEARRHHREQEAYMQSVLDESGTGIWPRIAPLLDTAVADLHEKDRQAIVFRFYEGRNLREVGLALGASEEAAEKRVSRALEKLRDFFHHRGITMPAAALAAAISEHSIQAAPAGLAASVAAGVVQGSALTVSTLSFVKGAIHIMTSTKINVAIGVGAAAIIALQWQQASTQKQTIQQLQEQVAQQAQTNRAQQAENEKLQERNAFYARMMADRERDVAKARARTSAELAAKPPTTAAAGTKGNFLAERFKDPDMLKAMRESTAAMIKMQYAPLVKQLNLSPEQADKFYQIMIDMGLKGLDAMQSGKFSADNMQSTAADLKSDLQSLLGDDGFAQYKDFVQNLADQTMFTQIKKEFVDNDNPLSDTQQQQLLQAMITARQSVTANSAPNPSPAGSSGTTAMVGQYLQQQEQINQNVLQQAAAFLSPEQLQTLATSQSNMLAMGKIGVIMAQKMFTNAPSGP